MGFAQWATAKEFPPSLVSIVPVTSPFRGVDSPMRNNVFALYAMQWLTGVSGHTLQERIVADQAFWRGKFRTWFEQGGAFNTLDTFLGNPSPAFQEWVAHPQRDAFWDSFSPTADQYARISLPILTITGAYDGDQLGALEHYREHLKHATPEACSRHYLIIGPWDHPGTRSPQRHFGGLSIGPESLLDLPKLHRDWYAWTMQGAPKPAFLSKRVAYYVAGAERWRYADSLE